jgi:hypothetical protein
VGRMRKSVMLMTVGESPADRSADNCALSVSQRIAAMINLVDCLRKVISPAPFASQLRVRSAFDSQRIVERAPASSHTFQGEEDSRPKTRHQSLSHGRRRAVNLGQIVLLLPFGPWAAHIVQLGAVVVEQCLG